MAKALHHLVTSAEYMFVWGMYHCLTKYIISIFQLNFYF